MGCLACGPRSTAPQGRPADGVEALITQTHSVDDANTVVLTQWLQETCMRDGVDAFYETGLSSRLNLSGKRRRRLRDAFEAARCVIAAAVGTAVVDGAPDRRPPLANEVLWAEQHNKPIVLLYDAGKPFSREQWQEAFPFLFRPIDTLVRYYGRGHDECRADLMRAVHRVLSDDQVDATMSAEQERPAVTKTIAAAEDGDEHEFVDSDNRPGEKRQDSKVALAVLRAAQQALGPQLELQSDSTKNGIIRQRPAEDEADAAAVRRRGPSVAPQPTTQRVKKAESILAAGLVIKTITNDPDDVASIACSRTEFEFALECLKASIGVSEIVVAKAIRTLAHLLSVPGKTSNDATREAADWATVAMRRHGDSVDACTSALEVLFFAQQALPSRAFPSRDASTVAATLREYPQCQALQRNGFGLLVSVVEDSVHAGQTGDGDDDDCPQKVSVTGTPVPVIALRGGGLVRVLTRLGVAELALVAIGRYHGDADLIVDACALLQSLAVASRDIKLLLASRRAARLWVALLVETAPGAAAAAAALCMLSSLVTDDVEVKDAIGEAEGLFEALEDRLQLNDENCESEMALVETGEIFGLLCRLTARHARNKQRCRTHIQLLIRASDYCKNLKASISSRLAAGGLLVNLCSEPEGRTLALEAGVAEAAALLVQSEGNLQRCGQALQQLLGRPGAIQALTHPASADANNRSAFDGIFAVRRSTAPGDTSRGSAGPQIPRAATTTPAAAATVARRGWQRPPKLGTSSWSQGLKTDDDAGGKALSTSPRSPAANSDAGSLADYLPSDWFIASPGADAHETPASSPNERASNESKSPQPNDGYSETETLVNSYQHEHITQLDLPENLEVSSPREFDTRWEWTSQDGSTAPSLATSASRGIKGNASMRGRLAELRLEAESAGTATPTRRSRFEPPARFYNEEVARLALAASTNQRSLKSKSVVADED